jgi:hypothetical protein
MTSGENKHETLVFMVLLERSGKKIDLRKVTKKHFWLLFLLWKKVTSSLLAFHQIIADFCTTYEKES